MDINTLQEQAKKLKEAKQKKEGHTGEWPNCSFLPDGNHKGRFIVDPNEELYLEYFHYGYFAKGVRDPQNESDTPEDFHDKLRELAEEANNKYDFYKLRAKKVFLVYYYLIETDNPGENWKPGNLYCILGNGRFSHAFSDMINSLVKDAPDKILSSLQPDQKGPILQITHQGGAGGRTNISATFSEADPIKLDDQGYAPLEQAFIKPGFNREKYNKLVAEAEKKLKELKARAAASESEPEGDKQSGDSEKKEDTPTQEEKKEESKPEDKPAEESSAKEADKPLEGAAERAEENKEPEPEKEEQPADKPSDPFAKYR